MSLLPETAKTAALVAAKSAKGAARLADAGMNTAVDTANSITGVTAHKPTHLGEKAADVFAKPFQKGGGHSR